jgi:N-acetylneuraminic acid mutarotase
MRVFGFGLFAMACLVTACGEQAAPPPEAPQAAVDQQHGAMSIPPLPVAVSNNAVALVGDESHYRMYSFLGLLTGKTWRDVTDRAFEYDSVRQSWEEIAPVPGGQGRLAGTAQTVAGKVYVLGGYTVAEDGSEVSWPGVYRLDPESRQYTELSPMPVPVDDTVSAVYQDRYLYLVSGWHDKDNVDDVQIYDTREDRWMQATPYPGPALFGHAGGLVDNQLLICDGVKVVPLPEEGKRDFVISDVCYLGVINRANLTEIEWQQIAAHPGPPLYRAAAAGVGDRVVFSGGSDTPYNYNGIGYDGNPASALTTVLSFEPASQTWSHLPNLKRESMDHRGLLVLAGQGLIVGGMSGDQRLTSEVQQYSGLP